MTELIPKYIINDYVEPINLKTNKKSGNATYFYKNNKQYLVTRESNYIYGKAIENNVITMYFENDGLNKFCINEALYEKNNSNDLTFIKYLTKCSGKDIGFEDPRCINWNNTTYILMNRRNLNNFGNVQMHIGIIDDNLNYMNDTVLYPNTGIEKNWQPIEDKPGICIYHHNEFKLLDIFNNNFLKTNNNHADLYGSSQIIRYNNGYLGICHKRTSSFEYLHYFIRYDSHLNIIKISSPFSFLGAMVEFVNHIELKDNKIKILVSIHDQLLYEFNIEVDLCNKILNDTIMNSHKNNIIFSKLYNDAILNNNIFAAIIFATFSNDTDILNDAIIKNHNNNYFRNDAQKTIQKILIKNYNK